MTPLLAAHKYVDDYMAVITKKTAEMGRPVRCAGAGCFWCCKEPVYAERGEVAYMLSRVTEPERAALKVKARLWWDAFFHHGFDKMPPPEQIVGTSTLMRYIAANAWCPFLADGKCSVYAARPLGCRYHIVIGSPKRCEDPEKRPTQKFAFAAPEDHSKVNASAVRMMFENEPFPHVQFDHLGIWLGHLLLGESERSRAGMDIKTTPDHEARRDTQNP